MRGHSMPQELQKQQSHVHVDEGGKEQGFGNDIGGGGGGRGGEAGQGAPCLRMLRGGEVGEEQEDEVAAALKNDLIFFVAIRPIQNGDEVRSLLPSR